MKLADYKKALKGFEGLISDKANEALSEDWRIGAVGALNRALTFMPNAVDECKNENTANSVLELCDRKSGK